MARKSIRVKKANPQTPAVPVDYTLESITGAVTVSTLAAQIPVEGFTFDPSFSGTITPGPYVDGATVTITRSGGTFGTKDHQALPLFEDWEQYDLGGPAVGGPWTYFANGQCHISDTDYYWGTRCLKAGGPGHNRRDHRLLNLSTNEIFISFRHRTDEYPHIATSSEGANWKFLRLSCGTSHADYPALDYGANGVGANNYIGDNGFGGIQGAGHYQFNVGYSWISNPVDIGEAMITNGRWDRSESYVLLSTPGELDGKVYIKKNGSDLGTTSQGWPCSPNSRTEYVPGTKITRSISYSPETIFQSLRIAFYTRDHQHIESWIDEIYFDKGTNAQARVEFAPSAGFGVDSRVRNPCPYTAWSTNSITINLNGGPNGIAGRALYFINNEGVIERIGEFS